MRCAVLPCLLSSLAYGQPAAPVAPAFVTPSATPAGTGLYRPNAPVGHPAAPLSPHKRVLPPTKESGIWAGDAPRASAAVPAFVTIEDVEIPIPEADSADARVVACGRGTGSALNAKKESMRDALGRMLPDMKQCVVYLAWRHCMLSDVWPDGGGDAAKRIVSFSDALMMEPPPKCKAWVVGLNDYLTRPFDWHLRAWYHQQYKQDAPP